MKIAAVSILVLLTSKFPQLLVAGVVGDSDSLHTRNNLVGDNNAGRVNSAGAEFSSAAPSEEETIACFFNDDLDEAENPCESTPDARTAARLENSDEEDESSSGRRRRLERPNLRGGRA